MPIGEIFLAAFIQVLFEKLASTVPLKFARREQVHTLFKKWSGELVEIQAFLDDAEEKQIENKAVKMWLEDLTDLAYDLDDILDEFATEALRHKLIAESQVASTSKSKLRAMIPTCCKGFNPTTLFSDFTRSSTSKVDEITTRLQSIFERGSRLGLQKIFAGEAAKAWHRPPPTSSVIHEHCIYGRDCKALRSLPGWTAHDSNLESLQIKGCDNLESLREEWVHHPPTKLSSLFIRNCKKLESVPSLCNNSLLASLKHLEIESWPAGGGIVSSYILENENFLTNLTYLEITNMKIGKPLSEWGLHRFSSLNTLWLKGPRNRFSLSEEEEEEYYSVSSFPVDGMLLPTSLMRLWIYDFPNLEKISSTMETIQNLTHLEFSNCPRLASFSEQGGLPPSLLTLEFSNCPRLASFPKQGGLPPSLLELEFYKCPIMKRRCEKGKGQYWPLIAPIPRVFIEG